MHILILTQYFPPETGAPQNRLYDLGQRLIKYGHTVTIITALPNYPRGEIYDGYRGHLVMEEQMGGVRVIRAWIYATKSKSLIHRLMNYLSFVFSSLIVGVWNVGRQDFVLIESPPLFLGFTGLVISRFKKAKLVFNVSDLWPESAVAMGIIRNKILIVLSQWLEEFLYRRSHLITGQTQGIVENIRTRFPNKQVALITNGVDVESFQVTPNSDRAKTIRKEFGLEGKFVVGYAGLHGLAQGLETVIRAAEMVAQNQNIAFALFGDGPEKDKLIQLALQARLTNVHFYPVQPSYRMPDVISSFDVAIIPLKRLDLFKGALPSKMFEALAAAVPVVVSIDGEARTLVEKARAGICVEPENPQALSAAIMQLYRDAPLRKSFGENGHRYVVQHHDRAQIARTFERLLLELRCEKGY